MKNSNKLSFGEHLAWTLFFDAIFILIDLYLWKRKEEKEALAGGTEE
ncbi:MAG: hypothetical protein NC084_09960 [Bacteroides sp.]|nr:hypothetical protein [Eubacterium sp.]MCM1419372.1 hypothetical protein [Roseburia sp.]MCM1463023.1 hypothetical protein [Bacteroides sp.]